MKINIVPIGNSKGIRIPKDILEQCRIKKYVDLEVENEHIVIKSYHEKPRKNWEQCFERMHKYKDDKFLIKDDVYLEMDDWQW